MSHWFPDIKLPEKDLPSNLQGQSGIALVVTLILLLVLMVMGAGISYLASMQSDLVAAVANKPISIEAGETCFDNAIEWFGNTSGNGPTWIRGTGAAYDLAAPGGPLSTNSVLADTIPQGQTDARSAKFKDRAGRASYSSCIVQKLATTVTLGVGNEVGTLNGYGASSFTYTVKITSIGNYNVPLTAGVINTQFWQSNSSRSALEAVVQYTP